MKNDPNSRKRSLNQRKDAYQSTQSDETNAVQTTQTFAIKPYIEKTKTCHVTFMTDARSFLGKKPLPERPESYSQYITRNCSSRTNFLTKYPALAQEIYKYLCQCKDLCFGYALEQYTKKSKHGNCTLASEQPQWLHEWETQLQSFNHWFNQEKQYNLSKAADPNTDQEKESFVQDEQKTDSKQSNTLNSSIQGKTRTQNRKQQKVIDNQQISSFNQQAKQQQVQFQEYDNYQEDSIIYKVNFEYLTSIITMMKFCESNCAIGCAEEIQQEKSVHVKSFLFNILQLENNEERDYAIKSQDEVLQMFIRRYFSNCCIILIVENIQNFTKIQRLIQSFLKNSTFTDMEHKYGYFFLIKEQTDNSSVNVHDFYVMDQFSILHRTNSVINDSHIKTICLYKEHSANPFFTYLDLYNKFKHIEILDSIQIIANFYTLNEDYQIFLTTKNKQESRLKKLIQAKPQVFTYKQLFDQASHLKSSDRYSESLFYKKTLSEVSLESSQKQSKQSKNSVELIEDHQKINLDNLSNNDGQSFFTQTFNQNQTQNNFSQKQFAQFKNLQDNYQLQEKMQYSFELLEKCLTKIENLRKAQLDEYLANPSNNQIWDYFQDCQICACDMGEDTCGMMCGLCLFTACQSCFTSEIRKSRTFCQECQHLEGTINEYKQNYLLRVRLFEQYACLKLYDKQVVAEEENLNSLKKYYYDWLDERDKKRTEELLEKQKLQQKKMQEEQEREEKQKIQQQEQQLQEYIQNPIKDIQYAISEFGMHKIPYNIYLMAKSKNLGFDEFFKANLKYSYLLPEGLRQFIYQNTLSQTTQISNIQPAGLSEQSPLTGYYNSPNQQFSNTPPSIQQQQWYQSSQQVQQFRINQFAEIPQQQQFGSYSQQPQQFGNISQLQQYQNINNTSKQGSFSQQPLQFGHFPQQQTFENYSPQIQQQIQQTLKQQILFNAQQQQSNLVAQNIEQSLFATTPGQNLLLNSNQLLEQQELENAISQQNIGEKEQKKETTTNAQQQSERQSQESQNNDKQKVAENMDENQQI